MNKGKEVEIEKTKGNTDINVEKQDVKENKDDNVSQSNNTKKRKGVFSIVGKVIEALIWIIIIFFLGILIVTTVSSKTEVFGYRMYVIMSGSMDPTIKINDMIITKKNNNVQVGDIIAFSEGNYVTVHRIIKVVSDDNEKVYETKGDANNAADKSPVKDSMINGTVKYVFHGVGKLILFLQSHLILLVLLNGVMIVLIIVRRMIFNE